MLLLPWEAAALEEDFHSRQLTNRIEIYLPAVTKFIVVSTLLPNALLLMNGHVFRRKYDNGFGHIIFANSMQYCVQKQPHFKRNWSRVSQK